MTPLVVAIAIFVGWMLVGAAGLTVARADLRSPRVALTAPMLGSALMMLPFFFLSNAGIGMAGVGPAVSAVLLIGSVAVLLVRRPRVVWVVIPMLAVAALQALVLGRPFFTFDFHWLANANSDMAYYVMSASHLLHHGLQSPVDAAGIHANRDLASYSQKLNLRGLRPGTQIAVAGVAGVFRRQPVDVYMPFAVAVAMSSVFSVGALAAQGTRKLLAPIVAGILFAISPLAGYAVLQQLTPQNWGLGLGAALFAWLMRPSIYRREGLTAADLFVSATLCVTLFVVAIEVAVTFAVGYALFVLWMLFRRRIRLQTAAALYGATAVMTLIIFNTFLPRALRFLWLDIRLGSKGFGEIAPFGSAIVPTALPGFVGVRSLFAVPTAANSSVLVVVGAVLVAALLVISVRGAARWSAAAFVVLGDAVLALLLIRKVSDFGLFKLYMYAQPFVAATAAVWLVGLSRRTAQVACVAVLVPVAVLQLSTLNGYVDRSFEPVDLRNASSAELLPEFAHTFRTSQLPVVTFTENQILGWLEGSVIGDAPLYVLGRDVFERSGPLGAFRLGPGVTTRFYTNAPAGRLLADGRCTLVLPSGSELPINRLVYPEGSAPLITSRCKPRRNLLMFVSSSRGQSATLPSNRKAVAFWQLADDPVAAGHTLAGFGRYALFQLLGPVRPVRVVLTLTTSPLAAGPRSDVLPAAAVLGDGRAPFPIVGGGSARVVSQPIRPRIVDGVPYIALDMGRAGSFQRVARPGLTGLWGRWVHLDPRLLTSYVRDVSVIPAAAYAARRPPSAMTGRASDLLNRNAEYSGIYEDGWVGRRFYAVLRRDPGKPLSASFDVLPARAQSLRVFVDNEKVFDQNVHAGDLTVRLPVRTRADRVRVDFRWRVGRPLGPRDPRLAAARLNFLGFAAPPARLARLPGDLAKRGVDAVGVDDDGWLHRRASLNLAGGPAGILVFRADVPPAPAGSAQHVRLMVGRHVLASQDVETGELEIRRRVPAALAFRHVSVIWRVARRLGPADARKASARLTYLGVAVPRLLSTITIPHDLKDPAVFRSGVFPDGWAGKSAAFMLSGGPAGVLTVVGAVATPDQRVSVAVNGHRVLTESLRPGHVMVHARIPASAGARRIQLHFARAAPISAADPRTAAALLQRLTVSP